jgi:hypothetical protein
MSVLKYFLSLKMKMTVNTIIIVKNHPEYDPQSLVVGSNQD